MRGFGAALLLGLAGCTPLHSQSECLVAGQRPMIVTELFFGREIPGRAPLSDEEWARFVAQIVTKEFPAGFTVIDGNGQWFDPTTHTITGERTKIVILAAVPAPDLTGRILRVRDAYRRLFHQNSVGVLTHTACGEF